MWYQCLGTAAPKYVHWMFASLVPGLPGSVTWPPAGDPEFGVAPYEITPVLPSSPGERQPDDITSYFLELLLDFMVSQAPKILWNDGSQMWSRSIEFLYERFKELYLPRIFHDFETVTDIFKPHLGKVCAEIRVRTCNMYQVNNSNLYIHRVTGTQKKC
jgi:hypothetical protein